MHCPALVPEILLSSSPLACSFSLLHLLVHAIRNAYAAVNLPKLCITEEMVDFSLKEFSVHCVDAQAIFLIMQRRAEAAPVCS